MVYPYDGILLSYRKEQTVDTHNNLNGSQGYYAEWKGPISKGYVLFDPTYITFMKWENYRDWDEISGCQVWRRKCKVCYYKGVARRISFVTEKGDGTVLYLDRDGGSMFLYIAKIPWNYSQRRKKKVNSWWNLSKVCSLVNTIVPVSISWY